MAKNKDNYVRTRQITRAAKAAVKDAIRKTFAAGLTITIVEDGWIVRKDKDGNIEKIKMVK